MTASGKAARNEQRKLSATTFNAIGLAFVAFGFVQPVVVGAITFLALAKLAICGGIGYILHKYAVHLLGSLED